jgi:hypothetical protein
MRVDRPGGDFALLMFATAGGPQELPSKRLHPRDAWSRVKADVVATSIDLRRHRGIQDRPRVLVSVMFSNVTLLCHCCDAFEMLNC